MAGLAQFGHAASLIYLDMTIKFISSFLFACLVKSFLASVVFICLLPFPCPFSFSLFSPLIVFYFILCLFYDPVVIVVLVVVPVVSVGISFKS